jgi:type I restriction enzyme S subunit
LAAKNPEERHEQVQAVSEISHAVTKGLNPDAPTKDSGVEWLGQVPAHWIRTKLLHVTEKIQTGPFGSQLHAEEYISNGIPVINPAHICAGALI